MSFVIPAGIRCIFFDAVGTLIHPDPPAAVAYAEVGRRFGTRYSQQTIADRFRVAFRRQDEIDRSAGYRTDSRREVARWRAIVSEVLDDVADIEQCFGSLYEHFARPSSWRVADEAAATLSTLASRGFRIGIASNFDERLPAVLAKSDFHRLPLVVSALVGWRKPAVEFFKAMCRAVESPPCEVLYVGDDPDNDYRGASAAGVAAVLYGRADRTVPESARVQRLDELL